MAQTSLELQAAGARGHVVVDGSLMSADVTGFTAMTERLARQGRVGAEQITRLLSSLFDRLIEAAADVGGDVLEFAGDSLVVLFDGPDHGRRAVSAGADMQRRLAVFTADRQVDLAMRIGVHAGPIDLFVAGRQFSTLVVTGPTATEAVGLEATAPPGRVLVSRQLAGQLPDDWTEPGPGEGRMVVPDLGPVDLVRRVPVDQPDPSLSLLVNPAIAAQLAAVERLGGEHRMASVAFVGCLGVAELIRRDGYDALTTAVEVVVDQAVESSRRYGANLLATSVGPDGFKLMLTGGVPVGHGANDQAVVRAALDLLDLDVGLEVRAGADRGRLFAGFLGPPTRHAYTVMGDVANVAARLAGEADPGELLAGPALAQRPGSPFETEEQPPVELKGKAEPITASRILAVSDGPGDDPDPGPHLAEERLFLVGRQTELATLDELCGRLPQQGAVVRVTSEIGMGARQLLGAMSTGLADRFETRCQRYDSLTPYAATQALLIEVLDLDPTDLARDLERLCRSLPPAMSSLVPLLAPVFDVPIPETTESEVVAEEFRSARAHELLATLLAHNLVGPTVLIFEDLHFADRPSRELLVQLSTEVKDLPLILIVSGRLDSLDELDSSGVVDVVVGPIDPEPAREVALATAGDRALSDHDLDRCLRQADGNPLFLIELVRDLVAGGQLSDSIDEVVTAMIDRLRAEDRQLLRIASVLGTQFELGLLDALMDRLGATGSSQSLGSLPHLVEVVGSTGRFVRDLYQQVCYDGLAFGDRRRIHLIAGELIEATPELAIGGSGILSLHFHEGNDRRRSWSYSLSAGRTARAAGAQVEAAEFLARAVQAMEGLDDLSASERMDATEALGDARVGSGSFELAAAAFQQARHWADPLDELRLMRKIGTARERGGDLVRAMRWYERALRRISPETADAGLLHNRAQLRLAICGLRHRQGRHAELQTWAEAALEDALLQDDEPTIALSHERILLSSIYRPGGVELASGEEALRLYEAARDEAARFRVLNNLGIAAYFAGDWIRADEMYRDATEAARRAGDVASVAFGSNNRAEILCDQGRLDEAEHELTEALRVWRAASYTTGVAAATMNLGLVEARRGDLRRARALLTDAERLFEDMAADYEANEVRLRLVEALVIGRLVNQAERLLDRIAGPDDELPTDQRMRLARLRGTCRLIDGENEAARTLLEQAEKIAGDEGADYELALVQLVSATCDERMGADAEVRRRQATEIMERLGVERPTPAVSIT